MPVPPGKLESLVSLGPDVPVNTGFFQILPVVLVMQQYILYLGLPWWTIYLLLLVLHPIYSFQQYLVILHPRFPSSPASNIESCSPLKGTHQSLKLKAWRFEVLADGNRLIIAVQRLASITGRIIEHKARSWGNSRLEKLAEGMGTSWPLVPVGEVGMLKVPNWAKHSQRGQKEKVGQNFVEGMLVPEGWKGDFELHSRTVKIRYEKNEMAIN